MRKKKQNKIGALTIILVLVVTLVLLIVLSSRGKNSTTLNLSEKRWIENNKKEVINVSVANNISVYSSNGTGIFHKYIEYVEDKTGLSFYMIPYSNKEDMQQNDFYFEIYANNDTVNVKKDDMIFYNDYYVLAGADESKYSYPSEINNKKIGVLKNDLANISYYLSSANGVSYLNYDNAERMQAALNSKEVDYIAVPRFRYLSYILDNNYHIVYNITEAKEICVLKSSNDTDKNLKNILRKSYINYKNDRLEEDYDSLLINFLMEKNNISEKLKTDFLSKKYVFGYIENPPYTDNLNGDLIGLDATYIKAFGKLSNTTFTYKKYNNIKDLSDALNSGEVDIAPSYYNYSNLKGNYSKITSPYKEKYVILTNNQNIVINSDKSLNGKTVYGLNTSLLKYLASECGVSINTYDKVSTLLRKINKNSIIALENSVYEMYKSNELSNYRVIYSSDLNLNTGYIVREDSANQIFITLMSKYMEVTNYKQLHNIAWKDYKKDSKKIDKNIIYVSVAAMILLTLWFLLKKKLNVKKKIKRDEVVRYVDPLTSLKNRNYLNKNFAKWESNSVYPQAVIIINLNNLRHVNDVYGHEEGDNLIRLAANVLIKNQLEQSDIIRTDGNEYLIYMVGYEKNKVVSYMRKLYKELGELPYGYGATMGYSMIEDDIKTIDDAINEAVLEIKANKEMKNK